MTKTSRPTPKKQKYLLDKVFKAKFEDFSIHSSMELDTVNGSNLFSQDEYIKQYLLDPDLSHISKVKIGLRYYITAQPELILQLTVFKGYLEKVNPFLFFEVFGKQCKDRKIW